MTSYSLRAANPAKTRAEAVVVGVVPGTKTPELAPGAEAVGEAYGRRLRGLFATLGVTGRAGEVTRVPTGGTIASPLLVLVGIGGDVTPDAVRAAAGNAARAVGNAVSVALALPADSPALVRAVAEGHRLGSYTFTRYRSKGEPKPPADVIVLSGSAKKASVVAAFEEAHVVADAVVATRDWVNVTAADLTPPVFADEVVQAVKAAKGIKATVLDEARLAEMGCGGLLAVAAGSAMPPRMVELSYAPRGAKTHLALVGKGITYDTGGLTIKTPGGMPDMKCDMSGAAAVVQATIAIARLGLPVRVSAFVPMAENMIGAAAMRPGDVITHYGGTTTEMVNADAEGRLILADALVRAVEAKPDAIIDVATLTGPMVTALGDKITGVLGTDAMVAAVLDAAREAGEESWPMPIPEQMGERVTSSKVADLAQHDWVRWGSGLFAAAFLREFTGGLPWAHLDIAGPAFHHGGAYGHFTPGGTGTAVATLVAYARRVA